tara:strand:+ start:2940 stop:3302 length:363 start_codon:yes stop_codon:yes gene_type:complete
MSRYTNINYREYQNNQSSISKRGYTNVKYPSIALDSLDIYVYTNRGDRYDLLAQSFYGDSSLWWIIARANTTQTPDSLIPEVGAQIRIPYKDRLANIVSSYKLLNSKQQFTFDDSISGVY